MLRVWIPLKQVIYQNTLYFFYFQRIEEIMKRTRKGDQNDLKVSQRIVPRRFCNQGLPHIPCVCVCNLSFVVPAQRDGGDDDKCLQENDEEGMSQAISEDMSECQWEWMGFFFPRDGLPMLYIKVWFVYIYITLDLSYGLSHPVRFTSFDIAGQIDDETTEADEDECALSSGEPAEQREEPLGSVNGNPETDNKENNNGIDTDETQAMRYDRIKDNQTTLTVQVPEGFDLVWKH